VTPLLKSISISNFRSIKGSVTIPLNAPVVLIHGQNGVGKTSVLSAIELALAGEIPSLARLEPDYIAHLVHQESDRAQVSIAIEGLPVASAAIEITRSGVSGESFLSRERSQFFSERCYLAQATLGRLLEIYEVKDTRKSASPLTRFVKDLLGLDHLDSLIEGLHDAGDVRRLRGTPYWDVREKIDSIESLVAEKKADLGRLEAEIQVHIDRLSSNLTKLGLQLPSPVTSEALAPMLEAETEEPELQRIARIRRNISAAREEWLTLRDRVGGNDREKLQTEAAKHQEALDAWRASEGRALEELFAALAEHFPDLPAPYSAPDQARASAVVVLDRELQRCVSVIERDAENSNILAALAVEISRARARAAMLDEQIAQHSMHSDRLVRLLAESLAHIDSEECPICGRNFDEISDETLQTSVSKRIAALTESSGRLQALVRERVEASRVIADTERSIGVLTARLLAPAIRDGMKDHRARLEELKTSLASIVETATAGAQLIALARDALHATNSAAASDQLAVSIREVAIQSAKSLELKPIEDSEILEVALERLYSVVRLRESALTMLQSVRREALSMMSEFRALATRRTVLAEAIADYSSRSSKLKNAKEAADIRITQARELARRSRDTRTNIVRRVFSDSLNRVWYDLFVRLAPDEHFVPRFALPENQGGPVEAVLETEYRAGGRGGNPRAMLSAGNLNTAALTLFLALHLSVKPVLPWLIIDDPVQSMDEVHVTQFAALLRTLSKRLDRQVVIAIHEKSLFDYLKLELSPAFPDDRLITVQMGRNATGETVVNYEPLFWKPDAAFAA
jgi:DNA repair protein SbcC/Rad50